MQLSIDLMGDALPVNTNNVVKETEIFLDEVHRVPGADHLGHYRGSCFYNLLNKSVKERGSAYEEIAAKILRSAGFNAEVAPASYGAYDLIVDGKTVELKASRKASPYDSRGRSYQFSHLKLHSTAEKLFLMIIQPDDVVKIYECVLEDIKEHLLIMHKDAEGNGVDFQLSKHPEYLGMTLVCQATVR